MISVDGNTISLTRGDTESLVVTVTDAEGNPYVLGEGEYIELCVKAKPTDAEVLIRKTTTDGTIAFERADTWGLAVGKYAYNVRVENGTTSYHTIIEGKLAITAVVDDAAD